MFLNKTPHIVVLRVNIINVIHVIHIIWEKVVASMRIIMTSSITTIMATIRAMMMRIIRGMVLLITTIIEERKIKTHI